MKHVMLITLLLLSMASAFVILDFGGNNEVAILPYGNGPVIGFFFVDTPSPSLFSELAWDKTLLLIFTEQNQAANATANITNVDAMDLNNVTITRISGAGIITATPNLIANLTIGATQEITFICTGNATAGFYEAVFRADSLEALAPADITVLCNVSLEGSAELWFILFFFLLAIAFLIYGIRGEDFFFLIVGGTMLIILGIFIGMFNIAITNGAVSEITITAAGNATNTITTTANTYQSLGGNIILGIVVVLIIIGLGALYTANLMRVKKRSDEEDE